MPQYIPPMSGGQETRVVPGPVRPGSCPTPTEIVVIEARKVFDFCFQEDLLERCFVVPELGNAATVTECLITNVTCTEVVEREPLQDRRGLALVSIQVNLTIAITIVPTPNATPITVTRTIAFPKRVVLCAPLGTEVTCDVQGTCICTVQPNNQGVSVTEPNICCTIQLSVVRIPDGSVTLLTSSDQDQPQRCSGFRQSLA